MSKNHSEERNSTGSTVTSTTRGKACPSPSFDARNLKNAQWSSTDSVAQGGGESFKDVPQTWTPRNNPSPSPDKKEFRPLGFDSNSLKRNKRSISSETGGAAPAPPEAFPWKDNLKTYKTRSLATHRPQGRARTEGTRV